VQVSIVKGCRKVEVVWAKESCWQMIEIGQTLARGKGKKLRTKGTKEVQRRQMKRYQVLSWKDSFEKKNGME